MARIHSKAGWFAVLVVAAVASGCGSGRGSEDDTKLLDGLAHRALSGNEGSAPVVVLGKRPQALVQSCTDCHTGFPQYDYHANGHGDLEIALGCEACHYNGNEHSGAYKELRPVNGFQYPAVGPDPYAAVLQRQDYCNSACHAWPLGGHPVGYFYSWNLDDWTYAELLTSQGYIEKYGYDKPMALPPAVLPLLDVDGNGVNSYGDIVMCDTCHDPHGTPEPFMARVTNTGSELCLACHQL